MTRAKPKNLAIEEIDPREQSIDNVIIMTPQEYVRLIFHVFFKGQSLLADIGNWDRKRRILTIIQTNVYSLLIAILVALPVEGLSQLLGFDFNFTSTAIGAIRGMGCSVALSLVAFIDWVVLLSLAWAATSVFIGYTSIIFPGEFTWGASLAVAVGAVSSVAFSLTWSIVIGAGLGASLGLILGLIGGLGASVGGSLSMVVYFLVWSRWFYFPVFLLVFLRKIKPHILPSHWDENIGAPLPFLTHLLSRLSRSDRALAVDEAIFLVRERPIQRKAAQQALVKIAVEEMTAFRDLRNIANLQQELDFLPRDPEAFPEFYNQGYNMLTRFAADAQVALSGMNMSNRSGILEELVDNIETFRKQMDFAKKEVGLPFGQIADSWLGIVGKELKQIDTDIRRPLPNPFIFTRPIGANSDMFVGRRDIVEQIQHECLREGRAGAILFVGNRRAGKTSTLLNLRRYLTSSLIPVFIDCQDPTVFGDLSHFSVTVVRSIRQALGEVESATEAENLRLREKPATHRDQRLVEELLGPEIGESDDEQELSMSYYSLADVTQYLKSIQADLEAQNQHLLLCFDEYERLTEKITSGSLTGLPDAFRYWTQHLERTICLFSGSHYFEQNEGVDWTDYLINVRGVQISYLDVQSARQLVTKPVPRFDLWYARPDTITHLIQRLGRQPYLIQATMSELISDLNRQKRKTAIQVDIDEAIEKMLRSCSFYFQHIWRTETTSEEREILEAIAMNQPFRSGWERIARRLVNKEILRRENDEYVFCVPVYCEWIVSNAQ